MEHERLLALQDEERRRIANELHDSTAQHLAASQTWVKVKCVQQDTFTIVGLVSDGSAVAALHLARRDGKSLVYVGKVGTGFSRKVARELHQSLAPLAIDKPPVATPVRDAKTMWVRPAQQTEIEYRAITGDGLLRHAAYKRLRERGTR